MESSTKTLDDRLSLEEVIETRNIAIRDCRMCPRFEPNPAGLAFGWCGAFEQYVKLYHPEGRWHSQCQFKKLSQVRELR